VPAIRCGRIWIYYIWQIYIDFHSLDTLSCKKLGSLNNLSLIDILKVVLFCWYFFVASKAF
jgi:hypothetical protein